MGNLYNKVTLLYIATIYFLYAANDTTKLNTPGNLDRLWLLMIIIPCLLFGVVAILWKKKAEQNNEHDISRGLQQPTTISRGKERCIDFV